MAKFIKPFKGVPEGDIYHTDYKVGDECPAELEDAARSLKALEKNAAKGSDENGKSGDAGGATPTTGDPAQ